MQPETEGSRAEWRGECERDNEEVDDMTEIRLSERDGRYCIEAQGHAEGDPKACAAASALLYAIGGYLLNEKRGVELEAMRLESGDGMFRFRGGVRAEAAFHMAAIGFLQLERAVPEQVKVKNENCLPYFGGDGKNE